MSVIIDNYETIVKAIVSAIDDGTIISRNSHLLQGKSIKELFKLFNDEFNLIFKRERVVTGVTLENNILSIPLPKMVYLSNMYFLSVGDVALPTDIQLSISTDNVLFFDITGTNVPLDRITQYSHITIDYVTFNTNPYLESSLLSEENV